MLYENKYCTVQIIFIEIIEYLNSNAGNCFKMTMC